MKDQHVKLAVINVVLWLAFLLALVSSISHLAWTFGTLEPADRSWLGWVPAVAVDAGLAALAYSIQQRKRAKQDTRVLWGGVVAFALISALANLYHALSVEGGSRITLETLAGVDWLQLVLAVVLSATLPGMVLYLGEVVSSDDSTRLSRQEQEEQRQRAREEREQKRLEQETAYRAQEAANEAHRLALAEQAQAQVEHEQAQALHEASIAGLVCSMCGQVFRNRQAKTAHKCRMNGHVTIEADHATTTNDR